MSMMHLREATCARVPSSPPNASRYQRETKEDEMRSNEFSGRIERNSLEKGFYANRIASPQLLKETKRYSVYESRRGLNPSTNDGK